MSDLTQVGGRRITQDISVQVVGRGLNLILGVAVTVIVVRILGADGFGQWSTIFAVTQIGGFFVNFGLEQVATREAARESGRESYWIGSLLALRLLSAIPVTIVSVIILIALSNSRGMLIASLIISATFFVGAVSTLRTLFWLRVRNDLSVGFELANGLAWALGVFAVAAAGGGIVALAIAFLAAAAITTAWQAIIALRLAGIRLQQSRQAWSLLLKVGAPVGIATMLILAYGRIDQVLVFKILGDEAAGLYGSVYRILDRIQLIPTAITTTIFPLIAAAYPHDQKKISELLSHTLDYLLMLSLPMFAFSIVISKPIITLLFGNEFAPAAPALTVLMGAFIFISFALVTNHTLIAFNLQKYLWIYASIALVFNITLNLLLLSRYGFMAAAWVTIITEALFVSLSLYTVVHHLEKPLPLTRMFKVSLASAGMLGILLAARFLGVGLVGLIPIGIVTYFGLLFLLKAVSSYEIKFLLRRRLT